MPGDTKDAVLAPCPHCGGDAEMNRRAPAPVLDGGDVELREQIAETLYRADDHCPGWSWGDVIGSDGSKRCYAAARALLPLINACIVQAEQAAAEDMRERAANVMCMDAAIVTAIRALPLIRVRNTEEARSDASDE